MILSKEITEFIANEIDAKQDDLNSMLSTDLLILIGVDTNNPPEEADYPLLIIEPTTKTIGQEVNYDYEVILRIGIRGSERPLKSGNIIKYDGIYKVEEVGNFIVDTLKISFECKTNLDMFDIDYYQDEIVNFPIYTGTIVIGFSTPAVIGDVQTEFLR